MIIKNSVRVNNASVGETSAAKIFNFRFALNPSPFRRNYPFLCLFYVAALRFKSKKRVITLEKSTDFPATYLIRGSRRRKKHGKNKTRKEEQKVERLALFGNYPHDGRRRLGGDGG